MEFLESWKYYGIDASLVSWLIMWKHLDSYGFPRANSIYHAENQACSVFRSQLTRDQDLETIM